MVVGESSRRLRRALSARVGDRLNRRSPTPVLVVHEDPDTEPLAAGVGRAQLRVA